MSLISYIYNIMSLVLHILHTKQKNDAWKVQLHWICWFDDMESTAHIWIHWPSSNLYRQAIPEPLMVIFFWKIFLFSISDINRNMFSEFQPTSSRLPSVRPYMLWCNHFVDNMSINPSHLSDLVNNLTSWIILDLTATACPKPGCSPASWFNWDDTNEAGAADSVPLGTN